MLTNRPPISNTERQRQFRERNPGYYRRLHARRRGKASLPLVQLVGLEAAKEIRREPLMLPAPAVLIEIPGMNAIPTAASARSAETVLLTWDLR
jgi:hypothetical protein